MTTDIHSDEPTAQAPVKAASSRRALLAGALGGIGAWAASAIGRASPTRGAAGDPIIAGQINQASGLNTRLDSSNGGSVFRVLQGGGGYAIKGEGNYGIQGTGVQFGVHGVGYRGVYGQTVASGASAGVYGHADANDGFDAWGVYGRADGPNNNRAVYGQAMAATGTNYGVYGTAVSPDGWAGYFTNANGHGVYISSDAAKTGLNVVGGSKNAVVATAEGARLMYAEESTEVWFSDHGFAQLLDGTAVVTFDAAYVDTVDLEAPYHVFVQAYGDAELFVSERRADGFTIRSRSGAKDLELSWKILAKRRGFNDDRMKRAPWADDDLNLRPKAPAAEETEAELVPIG